MSSGADSLGPSEYDWCTHLAELERATLVAASFNGTSARDTDNNNATLGFAGTDDDILISASYLLSLLQLLLLLLPILSQCE